MLARNAFPVMLVAHNGEVSPIPEWEIAPEFLLTDVSNMVVSHDYIITYYLYLYFMSHRMPLT